MKKYRSWTRRIFWSATGIVAVTFALYGLIMVWLLIAEWRAGVAL